MRLDGDQKKYRRQWAKEHPERCSAYSRKWRQKNLKYVALKMRQWRKQNKKRVKIFNHNWYVKNKEQAKTNARLWGIKNKAKVKILKAKYRRTINGRMNQQRAKSRRRAKRLGNGFAKYSKQEVINRDGYKCHICKKRVTKANLVLDHIIPIARGGSDTISNVAIAHRVCNARKGARSLE